MRVYSASQAFGLFCLLISSVVVADEEHYRGCRSGFYCALCKFKSIQSRPEAMFRGGYCIGEETLEIQSRPEAMFRGGYCIEEEMLEIQSSLLRSFKEGNCIWRKSQ